MVVARLVLLLLPQVWVAYAYWTFHDAVGTVLPSAASSLRFGLLTDTMVIVVLGVVTLTANCLLAAFLVRQATGTNDATRSRSRPTWLPAVEERRSGPTARSNRRPVADPTGQSVRFRSPATRHFDPRRREDDG